MNSVAWRLDLLQENADQLEGLWSRRLHAERSPELDVDGLNGLDRQIVAHADALALAGAQAGPILDGLFAARNLAAAAAAAFVIGWGDAPAMVPRLLEAFAAARQRERRGMVAALELRAGRVLLDALATSSWAAPSCPDVEARAGVIAICAAHGDRRAAAMQPESLLGASSPAARALAWRAVRHLASRTGGTGFQLVAARYEQGRADADAAVQRAALEAAVRAREPGLLGALRRSAAAPDVTRVEGHLLFAVLAGSEDVPRVIELGRAPGLGWERYRVWVACGRAPAVEALLAVMRGPDRVEAALAGAAFRRITGVNVALAERVPLVPSGTEPDAFTDLVHVCDPRRAEQAWAALRDGMGAARWAHGVDVESTPLESLAGVIDLEARWAAELRAAFAAREGGPRSRYERLGA